MGDYYDIDGKPLSLMEWATRFEDSEARKVAADDVNGARVSTVFLGIDHSFGDGPPLIFETMVFGFDQADDFQWRYSTKEQAIAGHAQVVAAVRDGTLTHDFEVA